MTSRGAGQIDAKLEEEDVLRRYLDMPRFISFLKTSSLYLCRSDLFSDNFEGSFTVSVKDAIINSYEKNRIKFTYDKFKKELREGVFINCWSLGIDDNMALWRLYGKSNDCVAVTTTVAKLEAALNRFRGQGRLSLKKVEYIKHWKDPEIKIKPYSNVFKYKTVGYAFENEVRIILDRYVDTFEAKSKKEGVAVPVELNTFMRSVVVSPECSPWFKAVVEDISDKYGVTCPVRSSSMSKQPI